MNMDPHPQSVALYWDFENLHAGLVEEVDPGAWARPDNRFKVQEPLVDIAAVITVAAALVPALVIMGIGWMIVMNVLQPRIMQGAVGIHPIVVLGSVLIGSKIAGIPGAIFGIPIAAVASAFFFHFLHRSTGDRSVTGRAAKRLSAREGRPVHVPREPAPGQAADVVDP